jgi:uncharacterized protein
MEQKRPLRDAALFSGITLGLSYLVFWGPLALAGVPAVSFVADIRGPWWATVLFFLGGFVPSGVAFVLTGIYEGRSGVRSLLRRSVRFDLGLRWYLTIVGIVVCGAIGQTAINYILGSPFSLSLFATQIPSVLPLLILGPLSEEYGWRGYLLVKLQKMWHPITSSVGVGLVWGLWHLPLFFLVGTSQHELSIPYLPFVVGAVAVSIPMTWVNNNTRDSIWAAIFFHWLYTYVAQVTSTGVTRSVAYNWLEVLPYVVIAIIVVLIWKPKGGLHA